MAHSRRAEGPRSQPTSRCGRRPDRSGHREAMRAPSHRREIEDRVRSTTDELLKHVRDEERLAVVQAPPGSGKTYLLLQAVTEAYKRKQRVAIATQTRSQADD